MKPRKLKKIISEIYSLTDNGKKLPPNIFEMVEYANDGYYNENGHAQIKTILMLAKAGVYNKRTHGQAIFKPHNVDYITADSYGNLYYKNRYVGHSDRETETVFGKRKLEVLQSKCEFLERCKIKPTSLAVMVPFDFLREEYNRYMYYMLQELIRGRCISFLHIEIRGENREKRYYFLSGEITMESVFKNEYQEAFEELYPGVNYSDIYVNEYWLNIGCGMPENATDDELRLIEQAFDAIRNNSETRNVRIKYYEWKKDWEITSKLEGIRIGKKEG